MTFELPEPVAWRTHPFDYGIGHKGVYAKTSELTLVASWERKGWKVEPLYTAQALKDVLEQAAQEATDAVAFNGGTVQMEAHVREAIRNMIGEI